MATFDFERLHADLYDLDDPDSAIAFQDMVEDFMNVAKTNPAVLEGKKEDVAHFCALVADDEAWPLAQLVVPEFCVTRYVLLPWLSRPILIRHERSSFRWQDSSEHHPTFSQA